MTDPRASLAPGVLDALRAACAAARSATDDDLLELARLRSAALLGTGAETSARPWGMVAPERLAALDRWPTAEVFDERDRAALALTEQFVLDVTGVAAGPLGPAAASMGASVVPFVQGLYLLDVGQRIAVVLGRLFDTIVTSDDWAWPDDDASVPDDPMEAVMSLLAVIGRGRALDPITAELVRLRGARLHRCRRCQSVRSVAALEAGADLDLLAAEDPATVVDLDVAGRAALALVDATFVGPPSLDDDLVGALRGAFDDGQLVDLVGYLLRNAANKVAVAFGADEAIVTDGFEYQVIDADGETITVDAPT
ncbi:MAG: hypothetical protein FGM58_03330 [Acidimicrobiia bacterium]|nr:hypothetical protein [Acidimicrobiia bacterium]